MASDDPQHWLLKLRDANHRRREGSIFYTDDPNLVSTGVVGGEDFVISLLSAPSDIDEAPAATAICVPAASRMRTIREVHGGQFAEDIAGFALPPHRMEAYASGRIVTAIEGMIAPADAFPIDGDRPDFEFIALALLSAADAEAIAPYVALIRASLNVAPGVDPLSALGLLLAPEDAQERPPARAPGIVRLAKALRLLRQRIAPESPIEEFDADLRFLHVFAKQEPWPADALESLLSNVRAMPARKPATSRTPEADDRGNPAPGREPVPFPSRRPPGDA